MRFRSIFELGWLPDLVDLDDDGDLDLVVINSTGVFATFVYCPEPGFGLLLAAGLVSIAVFVRRRILRDIPHQP